MTTRREFLTKLGLAGGNVYVAMRSLDLIAAPRTQGAFELQRSKGAGRVLILGAGAAGLCAAYELQKAGYDCKVLEASRRVGGRVMTVRRGTRWIESRPGADQTCEFGDGLYMNAGAARIPQDHVTIDYCRELGVAVEPLINQNYGAYVHLANGGSNSGRNLRQREISADMRGLVAEMLSKAVSREALELELSAEDKEKLLAAMRNFGDLDKAGSYGTTSRRRGLTERAGFGERPGTVGRRMEIADLLGLNYMDSWKAWYFDSLEQQSVMLQVVGGMDRLTDALFDRVSSSVVLGAAVTEIRKTPAGVRVVYRDVDGKVRAEDADYCVCTIPLPVLKDIPADFSAEHASAIANVPLYHASKCALQMSRRFWEEDDKIFGGVSYTDLETTQIWYPSNNFLSKKGVLVGAYNFGTAAVEFGSKAPRDIVARTLEVGTRLHPQMRDAFENGFSVSWHDAPLTKGAYTSYTDDMRRNHYPTLVKPDDRIYLAGEHTSYLTSWIAGAFESARAVTKSITERLTRY